jgi:hypothetical protein
MIDESARNKPRPSCWLFADNTIDIGQNLSRAASFSAYLKHALLFHDRLIIGDSNVVNTPNFRFAMQADVPFRKYLAESCLDVASRIKGDQFLELRALREELRANQLMNVGFDIDPHIFRADDDLIDLSRANQIPYNLISAGEYYTDKMRDFMYDPIFAKTLGGDAERVSQAILDAISERGTLQQRFFEPRAPGSLKEILGEEIWHRSGQHIRGFEIAFYRNSIPAQVQADIIFSNEHRRDREVLRGIGVNEGMGIIRIDLSRGAKGIYESALSRLSIPKLAVLRGSEEFKEFQRALIALQAVGTMYDPRLEPLIQNVYEAIHVTTSELTTRYLFSDTFKLEVPCSTSGFFAGSFVAGPGSSDLVQQ